MTLKEEARIIELEEELDRVQGELDEKAELLKETEAKLFDDNSLINRLESWGLRESVFQRMCVSDEALLESLIKKWLVDSRL